MASRLGRDRDHEGAMRTVVVFAAQSRQDFLLQRCLPTFRGASTANPFHAILLL